MKLARSSLSKRAIRVGLLSTLMLVAVAAPVAGAAQTEERIAEGEVGERIAEWATSAECAGFRGAVLAARDGEVIAALGVGPSHLKGDVRNTAETLFEIASATKPFTAAAIMRLVQDGALRLDDSIAEHLPRVPKDCRDITVEHLLRHTSGIPATNSNGGGTELSSVLKQFLNGGPQHPPGRHFEYWNQGYALLSEIIARASGSSYVDYCRTALFEPAGMTNTLFTGDRAPSGMVVAVGQSSMGKPRSALEHPYGAYGFQYRGMGGVVTTVWDLWRWDRALAGDEPLGRDAKKLLFQGGLGEYALGWYVKPTESGRRMQSHTGRVRGFVCDIRRYPDDDACLFVLANDDSVPVMRVAQGLEELLFGESPTIVEPPRALDPALLNALEGTYEDDRQRRMIVTRDGVVLRAEIQWGPGGPVSRCVIGQGRADKVVLYQWTEANELKFKRRGKKPVKSVSFLGSEYRRKR